jgi:hypothetical protein
MTEAELAAKQRRVVCVVLGLNVVLGFFTISISAFYYLLSRWFRAAKASGFKDPDLLGSTFWQASCPFLFLPLVILLLLLAANIFLWKLRLAPTAWCAAAVLVSLLYFACAFFVPVLAGFS